MKYRNFTEKELKWLKSFDKVMKKAPGTLFMFVGNGIAIYAKDENNNRYMTGMGGVDCSATQWVTVTDIDNDGGDY